MTHRLCDEELKFIARLTDYIERKRCEFEAKRRRPLTRAEREGFAAWEHSVEESEWDNFYGPPIAEDGEP